MDLLRRRCVLCGANGPALCAGCARRLVPPPTTRLRGVGRVPALFAYEGIGAAVVQALKFGDGRRLVTPLATQLATLVEQAGNASDATITWLPTTSARRRGRGFDQSELLARAVARRLDRPVLRVLRRRPGPSQTGRSRAERARNVGFDPRRVVEGPLVVVDDVCTTGATLHAASRALRGHVAGSVGFVVVARTP